MQREKVCVCFFVCRSCYESLDSEERRAFFSTVAKVGQEVKNRYFSVSLQKSELVVTVREEYAQILMEGNQNQLL